MSFLGKIGGFIMTPLYYLISVVLVGAHQVLGALFGPASGISWALSIVVLTLVIRAALIPLFVKQIKSSRNMQLIQPQVKELQKKYGHDRERLGQETMKLYRETGTNPFASCLPLIIQMPIFIALFRLLDQAAKKDTPHGVLTPALARSFGHAPLFGGQISSSFVHDNGSVSIKIMAAVLVVAMTATTFLTQRQLMSKNMPSDALTGPYAQQQKLLLYVLPVVFAVGGIAFPIGVLLYWTTSNLWTMCQQFYVIRNNPAPNTEAFRAKQRRDAAKAARHGGGAEGTTLVEAPGDLETGSASGSTPAKQSPPQRSQPKRQSRSQRKKSGSGVPGQASRAATGESTQSTESTGATKSTESSDSTEQGDPTA